MIRVVLLFFLITSIQVSGQSKTLKGKISADELQGFAINIVNFTKGVGTTNDEKGFFNILASPGDLVVFSSVQYQKLSLIITKEDLENKEVAIILKPVIQKLEQVEISNIRLSGNLNNDTKGIEVNPLVNNRTLGLPYKDRIQPTQVERRIYTAKTSTSGIPLDFLINVISGRLKKLNKIGALEKSQVDLKKAEATFNTSFFVDSIGIPQDLISDFIYYCAQDLSFKGLLENQERFTLLEFFQKKSKSYKTIKEIE